MYVVHVFVHEHIQEMCRLLYCVRTVAPVPAWQCFVWTGTARQGGSVTA